MLEAYYPHGPWLEIFASDPVAGWDAWPMGKQTAAQSSIGCH